MPSGSTGPPANNTLGSAASNASSGNKLGHGHFRRPVEHDAQRALRTVGQHEDDGAEELVAVHLRQGHKQLAF